MSSTTGVYTVEADKEAEFKKEYLGSWPQAAGTDPYNQDAEVGEGPYRAGGVKGWLTSQQAADQYGISRPFVVRLCNGSARSHSP